MANQTTDAQLVDAALAGSLTSFEALVERHQDHLYAQALSYLRVKEEAQDAVQDAFLQAFSQLATLRQPARFAAWIGQMLRYACLNRLRAKHRHPVSMESAGELAGLRNDPEQAAGEDEAISELLAKLPGSSARSFALHYLEGYSLKDVALATGATPSAVKQRLYRARIKLQEEIMDMAKDDEGKFDLPDGFAAQTVARLLEAGKEDRLYMRMDEARARFKEALAVSSDHPGALEELGKTYDPIEGPTTAETATLQRAMAAAPDSVEVASALATALTGDADAQAAAVERCLALCEHRLKKTPDDRATLVAQAQMFLFRRDFARMEQVARQAVSLPSENQQCLNYLALSLARQGRWDEAYPIYERLYELDDRTVWAYFALRQMGAYLAFHKGDWQAAVAMQEEVWRLTRRPNEASNLIYFYGRAGMTAKARALFAEVKDHRHPKRVYEIECNKK